MTLFKRPAAGAAALIAAAVILPAASGAGGPAGPGKTEFTNFSLEGEFFSFRSEKAALVFSGDGAVSLSGASGVELRFREGGAFTQEPAGFLSGVLNSFPLEGIERGAVFFEAAPSDFLKEGIAFERLSLAGGEDGSVRFDASGLRFGDFEVQRVEAIVRQEGTALVFPGVRGVFAGGEFFAAGTLCLSDMGVSARGNFRDVAVEELPGFSGGGVSGRAEADFEIEGSLLKPGELSGGGGASFSGGNITGIPLPYGLAPAVLRAPYRDSVFTCGEAGFRMSGGEVALQEARLIGEEVSIHASGTVGFDGSLDLSVASVFSEKHLRSRAAPVEVLSHVLKACDFLIISHRLTGTIAEPSYQPVPLPAVSMLPLQIKRILGFLLPLRSEDRP